MIQEILTTSLGWPGRMISGSKSGYRNTNPKNFAIFNANICTRAGKVWFGDIDLTLQKAKLQEIAQSLNETLYVLYEMDARFENENSPLLEKAAATFLPDGTVEVKPDLVQYIDKSFFE
jgi:hypothetical protein